MTAEADKAIERFIERIGLSAEEEGLPRIAGRLLGLFIVHGGPFSFSELADRLLISRGSVSTNVRVLRGLGLIEKTAEPGDRQDYYQLVRNPYSQMLAGNVERMRVTENDVTALRDALPEDWKGPRYRLGTMQVFYTAAIETTQALIDRLGEEYDSQDRPEHTD